MRFILFTKPLIKRDIKDVVSIARDLGFDGLDLLIRDGDQIRPSDDLSDNLSRLDQSIPNG